MSIRNRVQSGTGDKSWTIHTNGSIQYRGRVVVPQSIDMRAENLREFHCCKTRENFNFLKNGKIVISVKT